MSLRDLRRKQGLTISELSERVGFSRTYVEKLEKGNLSMNFKGFKAFADYFGMTLDEFYAEVNKESAEDFIRNARRNNNLTQIEFRDRVGISVPTIAKIETRGVKHLKNETKRKLANYFEIPIEELFGK